MTQAYPQLLDQIHIVRRSWSIRRAVEGLMLTIGAALAVLAMATALDYALAPGMLGRWALALMVYGLAGFLAWRFLARPLSLRHCNDFFAALIEQTHPQTGGRLINALQLGRDTTAPSPRLIDAIVADAVAAADMIVPGRAVAGPLLRRAATVLALALILAVIVAASLGPALPLCAARVLLPGASILPFTWTRIAVTPGSDVRILEGESLEVAALVTAHAGAALPTDAVLHWTDIRGNTRSVPMNPQGDGRFIHRFASINSAFTFQIQSGDARSPRISVAVEPSPRIAGLAATYRYPAYTALPDREVKEFDGHLHGLITTQATLTVVANKPLSQLEAVLSAKMTVPFSAGKDATQWSGTLSITAPGSYYFRLVDQAGNSVDDPVKYSINVQQDTPPMVAFSQPARDVQVRPEDDLNLIVVAQDDLGLAEMTITGIINPDRDKTAKPVSLSRWDLSQDAPLRRTQQSLNRKVADLGLAPGDRLEYWATVLDRNHLTGPGRGESRRFSVLVLTPAQSGALLDKQLGEFAKVVTELIRLQRLNRNETAGPLPALPLVERQDLIRRTTLDLTESMRRNAFPAKTMIDELHKLASDPMPKVINQLEAYRDAQNLDAGKAAAAQSLPLQDQIIKSLEDLLQRMMRDQLVRQELKKLEKTDKAAHRETADALGKLTHDLDKFLAEERAAQADVEKLPKQGGDESKGEDLKPLNNADFRVDRWKQWAKDAVDGIAMLPQGFVKDAMLAQNVSTIFEEIEKKAKTPTVEIATPTEEGAKLLAQQVKEDLEIWMMDHGDNIKWNMENPLEGKFDVPEAKLPDNLQDMVGDLVEDLDEFDEEADDITSSWGGNVDQAGWDIADGPISSFAAQGKTGNQMPNASEITGRSGAGRRGRATGQMVGDTSTAMEGRPTPARVTNEKYEAGMPKADKLLDPRGSTGGGKKTGSGAVGLQGGTPPDFLKDMERLKQNQLKLRERTQQLARQLEGLGRPSLRVNRAQQLLEGADQDLRDLRYEDGARKRKLAIGELKAEQSQVDQSVSLALQKAQNLPPEMRQQITTSLQQALPEGYEDLVGAYYKALTTADTATVEKP